MRWRACTARWRATTSLARFQLDAFDRLYERAQGAARRCRAHGHCCTRPSSSPVAYMPYKIHAHRIHTDLTYPWVFGYRRPLFAGEWWHMIDRRHWRCGVSAYLPECECDEKLLHPVDVGCRDALAPAHRPTTARWAAAGVHARAKPVWILRASSICIRATSPPTSSSRHSPGTTWRARSSSSCSPATGDARALRRLPHLDGEDPTGHLLRRRPGLQGQEGASWWRPTTCTRSSASSIRANKSPVSAGILETKFFGPGRSCAMQRAQNNIDRSTTTGPSRAYRAPDRYTLRVELEEPRPGFAETFATSRLVRRRRARGGRVLRRSDRCPSGRHRARSS